MKLHKSQLTSVLLLSFGFLFFNACKHETFIELTGELITSTQCSTDTVYFVNNILPMIASNCNYSGCHGNGSHEDGVDLTSYERIITTGKVKAFDPSDSEIYEVITKSGGDDVMPPSPYSRLTSAQINMLKDWINQGALNNQCLSCDTTNVTFSASIAPLVKNKCEGCHSGNAPQGGLLLRNYNEIKASVDDGSFLRSLYGDGYVLMPYGTSPLPDCEIEMIEIWITAGSPNN